ncbi:MAG: ABC transporter substrate-binding protein [Acidobacteria bacterium]|nr:ABC transporter substrate-binding protein [Acidobacteriota bacterium]
MKTKTLPKLSCLIGVLVLLLTCPPVVGQEAQSLKILRWALGAPQIDPLLAQTSIAKELGYFAEGGIDVEVTPLGGGGRSVPLVASGRSEIGYIGAETMLLNASQGRDAGIVLIFNQNRDPIFSWVVLPDSPIKTIQDVKGKTLGTLSLAAASTSYAKGILMSLGIDPENDVDIVAVGTGPSSTALLQQGQIDALIQSDTILAAMEQVGAQYRYLPNTEYMDSYFQGGLFVRRDYLRTNRKEVCAYVRGLAKGVEFAFENPEAAIHIHWKIYPESKPRGISEEQALQFSLAVLRSRMYKWDPSDELVKKHGAYSHEEWMKIVELMGLKGAVTDEMVRSLYSNEVVECANDFDAEKVREQARNYRLQ